MFVYVYKSSPKWLEVSRWFHLTADELRELHVATYRLRPDEDGDVPHFEQSLQKIKDLHPNNVVYLY